MEHDYKIVWNKQMATLTAVIGVTMSDFDVEVPSKLEHSQWKIRNLRHELQLPPTILPASVFGSWPMVRKKVKRMMSLIPFFCDSMI
jgi:hypothetical protein